MKHIAQLLAVLVTGCETTCKDSCCVSSRCADSRPRQDNRTAAEKVGGGLFWLAQSALYRAATDTVQVETPFPH
ncbi:MAG: hypothetical protein ABIZ56_12050 [Chthoniobacteraceae bacterium]